MAIELTVEPRTEKNPRLLRRNGFIPGVLYGADVHEQIQVSERELTRALSKATRSSHFKVSVGGATYDTFLREVQYHPLKDEVLHIDFYRPLEHQTVTMSVPIKLNGSPIGLKMGGTLFQIREFLPIRGPMEKIPERIELDVSNMDVGAILRLGDLDLEGVSILLPLDSTIATVKLPRRIEVTTPEEGVVEAEEGVEGAPAEGEEGAAAEESAED